jgi:heme/copper-type cytochrome/quinol oxidase subunit 4
MGDYQAQINTIMDNQKYLMSGVNTIYPSFSLDNLIDRANKAQYDGIKDIDSDKKNEKIQKLLNLASIYNQENNVLDVNEKLIINNKNIHDSDFNENIEKIDKLNNIISTKNKTIQINEYEQSKKDRIIYIMQKIILFIVLMIVPIIFMAMGYISIIIGIVFILVCAIITVIVVFFQMKNNQDNDIVNIMNKTKNTAKDFAKTVIKDIFPKSLIHSCPSKDNPNVNVQYNYNTGNEVWLDNSQNMWEEGDIPSIGATKQGYLALGHKAEPSPYYGGDPKTPQYKCMWTDDPAKRTNMNRGIEFTTTIPCEYYPGYNTVSKNSFPS